MAEKVGGVYYDVTLETKGLINGEREAARSIERVGSGLDRLGTRVTAISSAIGAAIGAIAVEGLVSKIVTAQRQFDVLFASLTTMTGSVDQAGSAWDRLTQFASKTPYSLEQAVNGFVKLKALGLDPGERAMTSYGNTAAAMGKSLSQMIEAVADASTGEFERLKEFGVKAKQEGDKVSLTFRGVTTTIANDADAITGYLMKIGEVEFAGAMSERMKTLDGDISNLQDSLAALYLSISQSGFGEAIAQGVRAATEAIAEATASIKRGGLTDYFADLVPYIEAAELAGSSLAALIAGRLLAAFVAAAAQAYATATAIGAATIAARGFGAVVALLGGPIGIAVTGLALLALNWDKVASSADDAASISEDAAKRIATALKSGPGLATGALSEQLAEYQKLLGKAGQELTNLKVGTYGKGTEKEIADAQAKVDALRQAIDRIKFAMVEAQSPSPLEVPAEEPAGPPKPKPKPKPKPTPKATGDTFDSAGYLAGLERATLDGYARIDSTERDALRKNDALLQQKKISLSQHLQAEKLIREEAAQDRREQGQRELDQFIENRNAKDAIEEQDRERERAAEAKRQQGRTFAQDVTAEVDPIARLVLEQERKTALLAQYAAQDQANIQLYAAAKIALEQETEQRITEIRTAEEEKRRAAQVAQLQGYGAMFGGMADLAKTFSGEQSRTYRAMFAVSKAFAVADSIIKIQQGIANAAALPFPASLGAMATVAAQTAGIISTINGTSFGGGRQYGGPVSADKLYRINETGQPEMFTGSNGAQYMLPTRGGSVTPADEVGGGGGGWRVIINNAPPGTSATVDDQARTIQIAVAQSVSQVANELSSNTGQTWSALRAGSNIQSRL